MKANAPEKIYIFEHDFQHKDHKVMYGVNQDKDIKGLIEYTRTDAFVEKAISYLNSKLYDWVQTTNPNQKSYANTIMKQDFINDFVNYIKGE